MISISSVAPDAGLSRGGKSTSGIVVRQPDKSRSGRQSNAPPGDYLIECVLATGESEFCYHRGQIHRFSKRKAEEFAATLIKGVRSAQAAGDPLCYSDRTKAFGPRSVLLAQLGATEKLREISTVRTSRFRKNIAELYDFYRNWYAPLAYLRIENDGNPFTIGDFVPVITNPLTLDRFLENWKLAGLLIPKYEVVILKNDLEFDDFALDAQERGLVLIADPLVNSHHKPDFLSGTPILSFDQMRRTAHPAVAPPMAVVLNELYRLTMEGHNLHEDFWTPERIDDAVKYEFGSHLHMPEDAVRTGETMLRSGSLRLPADNVIFVFDTSDQDFECLSVLCWQTASQNEDADRLIICCPLLRHRGRWTDFLFALLFSAEGETRVQRSAQFASPDEQEFCEQLVSMVYCLTVGALAALQLSNVRVTYVNGPSETAIEGHDDKPPHLFPYHRVTFVEPIE